MTIQLDHFIVPTRDQVAAAQLLAGLLDVPWSETALGPFSPWNEPDGHQWEMLTASYARRV